MYLKHLFIIFVLCIFSIHSFSQQSSEVFDIDGNEYSTIKIGDQEWMIENLKTTHLNDGSAIKTELDSLKWIELESPGYCWYKNDSLTYKSEYGALYNQYATENDKLCPEGWRVASKQDFFELILYLDSNADTSSIIVSEIAGEMMKEEGNVHWPLYENITVSNSSGFTALPGGCRGWSGWYNSMPQFGYFRTSSSWTFSLRWSTNRIFMGNNVSPEVALSVRCVREYEEPKEEIKIDVEILPDSIMVYPNPASNYLNIRILSHPENYIVKIYNLIGVLYDKEIQSELTTIDISSYFPGIYFVVFCNINTGEFLEIRKTIIII